MSLYISGTFALTGGTRCVHQTVRFCSALDTEATIPKTHTPVLRAMASTLAQMAFYTPAVRCCSFLGTVSGEEPIAVYANMDGLVVSCTQGVRLREQTPVHQAMGSTLAQTAFS